jgi:hypothetical protein
MGLGAHLKRWEEKAKCQKMNVNSRGQNPLKLLYFIMILNTISMPYKAWPTKWMLYMFKNCDKGAMPITYLHQGQHKFHNQ